MNQTHDIAQQYDDATDAITNLLDAIRSDIARHNRDFTKTSHRNWGHVGDLNHVRDLLPDRSGPGRLRRSARRRHSLAGRRRVLRPARKETQLKEWRTNRERQTPDDR